AAAGDDERPVIRHWRLAQRGDGNKSIEADVIRLAGDDRGVIFAAAARADTRGAGQPGKIQSVFDAPEIPREVVGAAELAMPFVAIAQSRAFDQGERDANDERC